MSAAVTHPLNDSTAEHSDSPACGVVRTPCYWTSLGAPLFGWLHAGREPSQFDHAVIIAPPIGHEQLHAHRSLRHLADALAQRGIPTFRFDWHGTGDSAGRDEDPRRLDVWRTNLRDSGELLKQKLAVRHISVIGLRFGAALAATTFSAREIENLVLWAPVVSGRTYVREMTAIDRTSEIPSHSIPGAPADLEPAGLVLSEATARDIAQLNLLQSPLPTCRTLLVARDDLHPDPRLAERFSAEGTAVEQIVGHGFAAMMADPHKGDVPCRTIQDIAQWLSNAMSGSPAREGLPPFESCFTRETAVDYQPEGTAPSTTVRIEIRERAVSISATPDLFGILSEPLDRIDVHRPTIVLLNAGASYRVGPGRLHVHLGRQLAAEGFRCLRVDANGLGDSIAEEGVPENQTYSATMFRDVDRTLRFLRENQLGEKFVLVGLCSGAYFAFQSAAALSDPSLIESVLINPLTYFWKDGMVISESTDRRLVVQQYYFESALDPRKWLKLFSGQTKIGWRGAARLLTDRFGLTRGPASKGCQPCSAGLRAEYSHPLHDDLAADLDQAVSHGRHLAMFFGETDPGYGILLGKAGKKAKQLQRAGRLDVQFIANTDHNFSRRSARRELSELLTAHLRRRYVTT